MNLNKLALIFFLFASVFACSSSPKVDTLKEAESAPPCEDPDNDGICGTTETPTDTDQSGGNASTGEESPEQAGSGQENPDNGGQSVLNSCGKIYYVRTGGGDSTLCNGLADKDYPGIGLNQNCAFSHPFILLHPGANPSLQGGDCLIIAEGSYVMGLGAPGANSLTDCDPAYPWECTLPPIPSGPDAEHPTRILGSGWDNGCFNNNHPPELFGIERARHIIDLTNSNNVEIACLEITDHSECIEFHTNVNHVCNRGDHGPWGNWASRGIYASDSTNVTLKDLYIHGLAHTGIYAGRLSNWSLKNVRITHNGWVGWDGDIEGDDGNSGTISFKNVDINWNGCSEDESGNPIGCWAQSATGYGDGLGTGPTGGTWVFEDCDFLHNTSDGLDLLYHSGGGQIIIDRVRSEGNAGNQIKTRGTTVIRNSVIIGNCGFFDGKAYSFLGSGPGDNCRAGGNSLSFTLGPNTHVSLINSTVYGEGDVMIEAVGANDENNNLIQCTGSQLHSRNNIFIGDIDYTSRDGSGNLTGDRSALFYENCGVNLDSNYCVIFGEKGRDLGGAYFCPIAANDICGNPELTTVNENDTFNMIPKAESPAINRGLAVGTPVPAAGLPGIPTGRTTIPEVDIRGTNRPEGAGVDCGAYEIP